MMSKRVIGILGFVMSGAGGIFVRVVLGDRPLIEHVIAIVALTVCIMGWLLMAEAARRRQ